VANGFLCAPKFVHPLYTYQLWQPNSTPRFCEQQQMNQSVE
jgi:hypothetical protein